MNGSLDLIHVAGDSAAFVEVHRVRIVCADALRERYAWGAYVARTGTASSLAWATTAS